MLVVNERKEDAVAVNVPIGHLKTRPGLEPVPRREPIIYHRTGRCLSHCAIDAG